MTEVISISDQRFYKIGEEYVPSVTTILSSFPKGGMLLKWVGDVGNFESNRVKNTAMEKGSLIHSCIEELINGKSLSYDNFEEDEWKYLMAFSSFWNEYMPETINKEHPVFSKKYKYAGTLDWFGFVIDKGEKKKVRIDWKTSNSLWPEYDIQLSTYEKAEREAKQEHADELWIVQLGNKTKKGYTIHKVIDIEKKFDIFLTVKKLWEYTHPNAKPFQKEIPTIIKLNNDPKSKN